MVKMIYKYLTIIYLYNKIEVLIYIDTLKKKKNGSVEVTTYYKAVKCLIFN